MFYRPQFLVILTLMVVVIFVSVRLQRKGLQAEIEAAHL
jgi:hypothetical protein